MHAGIAGAGIMGRLLALALHQAGWQVTLFDQNEGSTNCSSVAAGLLTPVSELDKANLLIFHLGQESINIHWPRILNALPAPVYFSQLGSLVLSHPHDQAEWTIFSRNIAARLQSIQVPFQCLSNDRLSQLEPYLAKFDTAYYFPSEAQIDCQSLMPVLMDYLNNEGICHQMNTPVLSLQPRQISTQRKQYEFDLVVDCRGLGARSTFGELRALRGELIWLHAPEVKLQRPIRFLHPRYSLYLVPRPSDIYLVGASEIEAEDQSNISVRTTLELLTAAYYVNDGFAEARIIKTMTHCRPTLPNHLPRIKFTDGLIAVNGLYRHGYLIAPTLAEEIVRGVSYQQIRYPEIWEKI